MAVSILFTGLYLAALGVCLFFAWKRSWVRSAASLGVSVFTLLESFLLTRLLVSAWGGPFAEAMKEVFLILFGLQGEGTLRTDATYAAADVVISAFLGTAAFILFFLLLWLLNTFLKRLLFRKISGVKFAEFTSAKPLPAASAAAALLSFAAVSFALLYPLGAFSNVMTSAAKASGRPLDAPLLTNPVSRVYGAAGRPFFDAVIRTKGEDPICTSDEIEYGAEFAMALQNVQEGRDADGESAACISGALRSSRLLPEFVAEVVANAAESWKTDHEFLNMKLDLPEGRSGWLVSEVLDHLSRWKAENLVEDVETAIRLYQLLTEYGITDLEDGEVLLDALSEKDFTERLFLELSGNADFIDLIPKVMRFGIGSALDAMHFTMDDDAIVAFDASSLGREEWRKEAEIFSRVLARLNLMIDGEIDLRGLLEDLRAIPDSKLLGNFIANLVIQVLGNLTAGLFR